MQCGTIEDFPDFIVEEEGMAVCLPKSEQQGCVVDEYVDRTSFDDGVLELLEGSA
jgi:hypothetical protein